MGPGFVEVADDRAVLLTDHFASKERSIRCACGSSSRKPTRRSTASRASPDRRVRRARREGALGGGAARALRRSAAADDPHATSESLAGSRETFERPAVPE